MQTTDGTGREYDAAVTYCNTSTYAGKSAGYWGMPNLVQMEALYDPSKTVAPFVIDNITATAEHWTSEDVGIFSTDKVTVDFSTGSNGTAANGIVNKDALKVICVH